MGRDRREERHGKAVHPLGVEDHPGALGAEPTAEDAGAARVGAEATPEDQPWEPRLLDLDVGNLRAGHRHRGVAVEAVDHGMGRNIGAVLPDLGYASLSTSCVLGLT